MEPKERLILALDVDNLAKLTPIVEALSPYVGWFKVGLELLTAIGAPQVVHHIQRQGGQIFLDGKFCDIPNTVGAAARAASGLGVKAFNVHASCSRASIAAAKENKGSAQLLVVTVLTSMDVATATHIFGATAEEKVVQFARDAKESGADGIICSPQELDILAGHDDLKSLARITPGIRPEWAESNDQQRILTPKEAIQKGATRIVVGRPILNPPRGIGSPIDAAKKILEEIASA